ncbi:ABC-type spermidine/putrescine transport system permease subunit I [Rhizobium sp. BK313]|uniref:ABC transporter permease n=1 Tax=Rhizobium sp. BK313 TaxID=2587081 RepID=UPI00105F9114|nr:ABC transporter permease subunit [Rhizobium sp. BK313]MBB3458626.1 ABC-type spermidine/putrescine transport system permease subunit I [Rhizobium sp. BK313]
MVASIGEISAPAGRRRAARQNGGALGLALVAPAFGLMILLILLPACRSLLGTIFPDGAALPSLKSYQTFFADTRSVSNLLFTIQVTVVTLAILLTIGLTLALYLRFSQSRFVGAIQIIALFPLFVPGIVISFALIRFIGPTGLVATTLHVLGISGYQTPYLHPSGAIIGLVWENIPLTIMLLTAGLAQISNSSIEAARDVGAGWFRILSQIILPQLTRSIVVAASLNFLGIFGSFTVPYILGPAAPQMMSIFMQNTFSERHDSGVAETQAAVTFLVCLLVGVIYTACVFRDTARNGKAG